MARDREPLHPVQGQQTVADRRALRGSYRQLAAETLAGKENLVNGGSGLQDLLQKVEALHSKAVRPREHAVDAEVFAALAQCGLQMIKQGQAVHEGRTPADLVRVLRMTYATDPAGIGLQGRDFDAAFDWAGLGADASRLFSPAPGVGCMLGPLAAQAKVRKPVVRQAKRPAAEAVTRPEELDIIEEGEKQETDRNYENMWRQLKQCVGLGQQVPLINLVCNHASFSQTVENIFTLSFLVRDQRVALLSSADKGLAVQPVSEEHRAAAQQRGTTRQQQFMMSFTMADWEAMKQLVPAADCVMPDRGHHHHQQQQQRAAAAAARAGGDTAAAGDQTGPQAKRARQS